MPSSRLDCWQWDREWPEGKQCNSIERGATLAPPHATTELQKTCFPAPKGYSRPVSQAAYEPELVS
jgi:hypothetical protein